MLELCNQETLQHCECEVRRGGRGPRTDWKWGGCSDNVKYGETVSKQFLDSAEAGTDPGSLANLHNSEAGRVAVRKTMKTLCKCHGVSGSCTTQTCWRQLGQFRETGKYLKKQYRRALRVDYNDGGLDRPDNLLSNRIDRVPRQRDRRAMEARKVKKKVKARKLVFLHSSPDYCRMNITAGYKVSMTSLSLEIILTTLSGRDGTNLSDRPHQPSLQSTGQEVHQPLQGLRPVRQEEGG